MQFSDAFDLICRSRSQDYLGLPNIEPQLLFNYLKSMWSKYAKCAHRIQRTNKGWNEPIFRLTHIRFYADWLSVTMLLLVSDFPPCAMTPMPNICFKELCVRPNLLTLSNWQLVKCSQKCRQTGSAHHRCLLFGIDAHCTRNPKTNIWKWKKRRWND